MRISLRMRLGWIYKQSFRHQISMALSRFFLWCTLIITLKHVLWVFLDNKMLGCMQPTNNKIKASALDGFYHHGMISSSSPIHHEVAPKYAWTHRLQTPKIKWLFKIIISPNNQDPNFCNQNNQLYLIFWGYNYYKHLLFVGRMQMKPMQNAEQVILILLVVIRN